MGIENRDYMQAGPRFRFGGGGLRDVVKLLIIVNAAVFVGQLVFTHPMPYSEFRDRVSRPGLTDQEIHEEYEVIRGTGRLPRTAVVDEWFALDPDKVLHGQIWRLTTYDFLHDTGSIWHLLFNMWLLFLIGRRVEGYYGSNEFLAFYLFAGILSGVVFLFWGIITNMPSGAIGASGAVVAVMIVYAMHWPHDRFYIWGIFPIPVIALAVISVVLDVYPMLQQLAGQAVGGGVAHAAHVGGMLFGYLYVHNRWRILDWLAPLASIRNPLKRRPQLRVHAPDREELDRWETPSLDVDARVDQLLEKISAQGEASLSDEERRFLTQASRRYRNRK